MSMYLMWVILKWDRPFSFSTATEEADIGNFPSLTLFSLYEYLQCPCLYVGISNLASHHFQTPGLVTVYLSGEYLTFHQYNQKCSQGNCRLGSSTTPIKLWFWVIYTPSLPLLNFRYLLFSYIFFMHYDRFLSTSSLTYYQTYTF